MEKGPAELVTILDFGSQYTQLIARRVRECQVYSEIVPYNAPLEEIKCRAPKALILSGGPASVTSSGAPALEKEIFHLGIPILGICYGMQLMARLLGGKVRAALKREYGRAELFIKEKSPLFAGLEEKMPVWMSHGDRVMSLPPGFTALGYSANSPIAAMGDERKGFYGLQFHPEVMHTPKGATIIDNFLKKIAGCSPEWTMHSFIKRTEEEIKERVGKEKVICALSGGVDSSVLALLLHKIIGGQLTAIFVDNGLLRAHEAEEVKNRFKNLYHINLILVDARSRFLEKLKGVESPEEKRKIIGAEFIRIFEKEAKNIGRVRFLAQGTLYPDVIESRSPTGGPSSTIKTHHNVGGLPQDMHFELIEPFKFLFKDEVRKVGEELGLPREIVWRHPFPGPGLAVRIIGEVTEERLRIIREAERILDEEIKKGGLYDKVWQAFAVLLPVRTVGVMGDERTYENVIALRAVTSRDGMTADWATLPYEVIARISNSITSEVRGVNRVVYDVSSKPPSAIEWE